MLETWYHETCSTLFAIALPSASLGHHLRIGLDQPALAKAPTEWIINTRRRALQHCNLVCDPARRAVVADPAFVFCDVDFPLLAVESITRRMAWVDSEPEQAFDGSLMVPLALQIEGTSQLAGLTRKYFPLVGPMVSLQ